MGCGNLLLLTTLITFSVGLIIADGPLNQDFPGPSKTCSISMDPVEKSKGKSGCKRLFHTAVTASDTIYNTWQCRVMYYEVS
ncbi:hypothetical protein CsatA_026565 [Cannabis sativa]